MKKNVEDNWYEDFFQGIACEVWEQAIPDEVTLQEVDFLIEELKLSPGQQVLDVQCGHGRHAVFLAKKGYGVTGVDISETFISHLSAKISGENLGIKTIVGDFISVQLDETFSGAICMGNSFGYMDFKRMKLFVQKVAASLEPGSKFIINSGMLAESILPNLLTYSDHNQYTFGEIGMEIDNEYDADSSCLISTIRYTKGGKSEEQTFKHYVFTLAEVKRLLESGGFSKIVAYGDLTKSEFKLGDRQAYIVAEKI